MKRMAEQRRVRSVVEIGRVEQKREREVAARKVVKKKREVRHSRILTHTPSTHTMTVQLRRGSAYWMPSFHCGLACVCVCPIPLLCCLLHLCTEKSTTRASARPHTKINPPPLSHAHIGRARYTPTYGHTSLTFPDIRNCGRYTQGTAKSCLTTVAGCFFFRVPFPWSRELLPLPVTQCALWVCCLCTSFTLRRLLGPGAR